MLKTVRLALTLSLVAILSACNSGSIESESMVSAKGHAENSQMIQLLNDVRVQNRLPQLAQSARLDAAARAHAADMAQNGFFSHSSPTAGGVGDRVSARGYDWCFVAENIAFGQRSKEAALKTWLESSGHRKNIMSKRATEFGFARASEAGGSHKSLWVMVFANRDC